MSSGTIRYCSHCGKPESEVRGLIPGPQANICNECIRLGAHILAERGIHLPRWGPPLKERFQIMRERLEDDNDNQKRSLTHFNAVGLIIIGVIAAFVLAGYYAYCEAQGVAPDTLLKIALAVVSAIGFVLGLIRFIYDNSELFNTE